MPKSKKKIKELPSKIKTVKEIPKEKNKNFEISVMETHEESSFTPAAKASDITLVLEPSAPISSAPTSSLSSRTQEETKESDKQTKKFYATSSYLTPEQQARRYELSPNPTALVLKNPLALDFRPVKNPMENLELQQLRNLNPENPKEQYDLQKPKKEKPKKRYPWET